MTPASAGAFDAPALIAALAARPRRTGSDELARCRSFVAERLREAGFTVSEQPFQYSTLAARFGMPAVGVASIILLAPGLWGVRHAGRGAAVVLALAALALLVVLARWLSSAGAALLPYARAAGVNLEAARGTMPRVWLVAHLDSKSQRYPLAVRALGATLTMAAWGGLLVATALHGTAASASLVVWIAALGFAGGALLSLASAGNVSPGAVDNASGVAAVLLAAARTRPETAVGILITDAEEAGLAGAHLWARGRAPGVAVNCDTVDDAGRYLLLAPGRPSARMRTAAARASAACGERLVVRRLPAGVLTDGVALGRAGWDCATLGRATVRTLLRIHTRRDSVGNLTGAGVAPAAALLEALVRELS